MSEAGICGSGVVGGTERGQNGSRGSTHETFQNYPKSIPSRKLYVLNYFVWWAASLPPWIDEKDPAREFQGAVGGVLGGA